MQNLKIRKKLLRTVKWRFSATFLIYQFLHRSENDILQWAVLFLYES